MKPDYELFDKNTQAIMYNAQVKAIQRMLDFDYLCGRKTQSIVAVVNPNRQTNIKVFFGPNEILIPEFKTLKKATSIFPKADVLVNFASFRSAYNATKKALTEKTIKTIAIIAEGIPERQTRELISIAKKENKVIIGPSTVGGIKAGCFKIGNTAGKIENIIASKLYRKGSVGVVSKSGGLLNEILNIVANNADGVNEGVAIGGDKFPCSTYVDHLIRYEKNPEIKFNVCLGEIGGKDEYEIIKAIKNKLITKPMVMWVSGTCAKIFTTEVQFGHAGAATGSEDESAQAKNKALKNAGVIVPNSFDDFGDKIKEVYDKLKQKGFIKDIPEKILPKMPVPLREAIITGSVRKPTNFVCTISDDRGDEPVYAGYSISELLNSKAGIGDMIGLLWFKKKLPKYATEFFELVLVLTSDHGPAVSGAHNAIVAARAGKDLVSSLASGLLTIGPRFGGAINGASKYFKLGKDSGQSAQEFVNDMKSKGIYIPGIGHRIKSVQNPDKRVEILKKFAKEKFTKTEYLDFAVEVEKITTEKRNNLILNVDGCIAVCFLDLCRSSGKFTDKELQEIVDQELLNAFFVLGRSIGIIGHIMDQYRLKERLYRHPWDDILFKVEKGGKNGKSN